jgi:cyanate permease
MVVSGITLELFPWGGGEFGSNLLRFLNGWAGAMSVIPLEAAIGRESIPARRTQNLGYLWLSMVVGGAVGFVSLRLYEVSAQLAFGIGSGVPVVAAVILLARMRHHSQPLDSQMTNTPLYFLTNFLSYGTGWCQGFLEGGMIAFLSLYLESLGYSESGAGVFLGVTTIGIIVFLVPISWLADRCGKTLILLCCYAVAALGLLAIPWLTDAIWLGSILVLFGASTGAMYPLGLSLLGDRLPERGLARAYAWYLAIECVGSLIGAAAIGNARDLGGEAAMFAVWLSAIGAVLAIWVGLQFFLRQRTAPLGVRRPLEKRRDSGQETNFSRAEPTRASDDSSCIGCAAVEE